MSLARGNVAIPPNPNQGYPALGKDASDVLRIIKILSDGTQVVSGAALPYSTLGDGSKTVAASATPEALAGSSSISAVLVQAKYSNTGSVFLGNATSQNMELRAGQAEVMMIDDPSKVFVKVAVNGEGVNFHTL